MSHDDDEEASLLAYGLGGIGAIGVAGLLVGIRGEILNANVALVLVIVVVLAAALGGRGPGMATAVVAAMSFDFFFTRPYLSLSISSPDDVETVGLLFMVSLIVGHIASRSRASRASAEVGRSDIRRIYRVAEQVASGADPADVILAAQAELSAVLNLRDCRFEASRGAPLPRLDRSGAILGVVRYSRGGFELPPEGVELPVLSRGRPVGRFVLLPFAGHGVSLEQRIVAVAIADQAGAALAQPRISGNGDPTKGATHG